jgi:hypothetical protein
VRRLTRHYSKFGPAHNTIGTLHAFTVGETAH